MKKNKFIPLAVLAGLFIVGFAMNNQQCAAEGNQPAACPTNKECGKIKGGKNRKCKKRGRTRKSETPKTSGYTK